MHLQTSGAARVFCKFDAAADERHFFFVTSTSLLASRLWPCLLPRHDPCALGAANAGGKHTHFESSDLRHFGHLAVALAAFVTDRGPIMSAMCNFSRATPPPSSGEHTGCRAGLDTHLQTVLAQVGSVCKARQAVRRPHTNPRGAPLTSRGLGRLDICFHVDVHFARRLLAD